MVDDDELVGDLIQHAFLKENLSCQLINFGTGSELLAHIENASELPALLLLDYYLLGQNGIELFKVLQENPDVRAVKVVLFSDYLKSSIVRQAEEAGLYDVERKPSNFNEWRRFAKDLCLAGHFS